MSNIVINFNTFTIYSKCKVFNKYNNFKTIVNMKKNILVLLDNGHGSTTPGKKSLVLNNGEQLFEWSYTREITQLIEEKLNELNINCVRIVDTDEDVSLSERSEIANTYTKKQKCIFISVHCNAAGNGKEWSKANGWEIWSTEPDNNSDKLAQCFLDVYPDIFPERKLRGHKEKNFTVIYKTNCPSVLTENFFMDNEEECKFLLSEEGKKKITELHVAAILKYLND